MHIDCTEDAANYAVRGVRCRRIGPSARVRARVSDEGGARSRRSSVVERHDANHARPRLRARSLALPKRFAFAIAWRFHSGAMHGLGRKMQLPLAATRSVHGRMREGRFRGSAREGRGCTTVVRSAHGSGDRRLASRRNAVRGGRRDRLPRWRRGALRATAAIACNMHEWLRRRRAARRGRRPRRGDVELLALDAVGAIRPHEPVEPMWHRVANAMLNGRRKSARASPATSHRPSRDRRRRRACLCGQVPAFGNKPWRRPPAACSRALRRRLRRRSDRWRPRTR